MTRPTLRTADEIHTFLARQNLPQAIRTFGEDPNRGREDFLWLAYAAGLRGAHADQPIDALLREDVTPRSLHQATTTLQNRGRFR